MKLTKQMLAEMIPTNNEVDAWHAALVDVLPKYEINTVERIAGFIAQCAHESADFRRLEENLNYSEKALNSVFSRYFGPDKRDAAEYARKPEKIANYVYQDEFRSERGALGNVNPGDGWLFRGRGIKQLTGRNNYEAFGKTVGMTAEEAAEYVATPKGAIESACWFWKTNNLNSYADKKDIIGMSRRINGGDIGLDDRTARWNKALALLGDTTTAPAQTPTQTPKPAPVGEIVTVGSRGKTVRKIQKTLRLAADGIFGNRTKEALKKWQSANGLVADGIAGPQTLKKMFG